MVHSAASAALCAALLLAMASASADRPVARDASSDLFDTVRRIILEGDAELGIPVLDPFQLQFLNGSIAKDGSYAVDGELRNLVVGGLAELDGTLAWGLSGLTAVRVTVDASLPVLRAASGYGFSGTVRVRGKDVDLYGDGPLEVEVKEVRVKAVIVISVLTFNVRSVDTEVDIGDIEVVVDGLLEGGLVNQMISAVVSELALELFQEQKLALQSALNVAIEEALSDYSLRDVLCLAGIVCSNNAVLELMAQAVNNNGLQ